MSVQANIQAVEKALRDVQQHCMCARFEDLGGAYRVLYAPGFRLDGVQAVYQQCGKVVALERMLSAMERHWKEDMF